MPQELCAVHNTKLAELHDAIYGNSHPENGLIWIAKENRRMINDLQEFTDTLKKWTVQIFFFLLFAGISAIGTFALQVYKLLVVHQS